MVPCRSGFLSGMWTYCPCPVASGVHKNLYHTHVYFAWLTLQKTNYSRVPRIFITCKVNSKGGVCLFYPRLACSSQRNLAINLQEVLNDPGQFLLPNNNKQSLLQEIKAWTQSDGWHRDLTNTCAPPSPPLLPEKDIRVIIYGSLCKWERIARDSLYLNTTNSWVRTG